MLIKKTCALLALSAPLVAVAAPPTPLNLTCELTTREFFAPLVQGQLIKTKPFQVEASSVNHFKPAFFKPLSVYGMQVVSVFGYADDPLLFVKTGPRNRELYGAIVREGIANVQAQLTSVGAGRARTFRVDSNTTIIACEGDAI